MKFLLAISLILLLTTCDVQKSIEEPESFHQVVCASDSLISVSKWFIEGSNEFHVPLVGKFLTVIYSDTSLFYLHTELGSDTIFEYNFHEKGKGNKYLLPLVNNGKTKFSICYYDKVSRLVLYDEGSLYLMFKDSNALVLNLNETNLFNTDGVKVCLYFNESEIYLDEDILYFPVEATYTKNGTKYGGEIYGYPLTASYNLVTKELQYIGLTKSKKSSEQDFHVLDGVFQTYLKGRILYSYRYTPIVHEYRITEDTLLTHSMGSCYQKADIKEFGSEHIKKKNFVDSSVLYQKLSAAYLTRLKFDGKYYYRTFKPSMERMRGDGFYNTYKDKRVVLTCYNRDFEYSFDYLLPNKVYFNILNFSFEDNIYMNYFDNEDNKKFGVGFYKVAIGR